MNDTDRAPVERVTSDADVRLRARTVHVIVPEGIDDPSNPSGGNAYDRRACLGLAAAGWTVREHPATGTWPQPDPAARESLRKILTGLPDGSLLVIDGLVACGVPDVVVPQAARLRMVVLVHLPLGDELGRPPEMAATLGSGEGRTLCAATAVVATSQWAARRVVELHGIASERVHVAAPGVEPAPPAIGTDGVSRLLCVGAVTRTKGQDLLVDALATLTDRPWRCNLVGPSHRSPGYVADLRASIDRHGLGGRVRLVGPLHPAQLATVYDATDLLVLPSRAETYGMVITEALARGIPVLAAATGGVPNTMRATGIATARATSTLIPPGIPPDGPTSPLIHPPVPSERATSPLIASRVPDERSPGMLAAPDDVAALAAGLRRWFDEPVLRAGLRRSAARRRDELTGWEVTSRCLAQVLDQHNGTSR